MNERVEAQRRAFDHRQQIADGRLGPARRVRLRRPCAAPTLRLGGLLGAGRRSRSGAEARPPSAESRHSRYDSSGPEVRARRR